MKKKILIITTGGTFVMTGTPLKPAERLLPDEINKIADISLYDFFEVSSLTDAFFLMNSSI